MANVLVERTSLENIADAIRTKTESLDTYLPSEMAAAIMGIHDSYHFFAYTGDGHTQKQSYLTCEDTGSTITFYSYSEE